MNPYVAQSVCAERIKQANPRATLNQLQQEARRANMIAGGVAGAGLGLIGGGLYHRNRMKKKQQKGDAST